MPEKEWRELPAFFYAERLLQDGEFQQQWRHCRSLITASQLLNDSPASAASDDGEAERRSLQNRMAHESAQCEQQLASRAEHLLRNWSAGIQAYLNEARLAIARMHDANAVATYGAGRSY